MPNNSLVFGLHAVKALLERHPDRVTQLYLLAGRQDEKLRAFLVLAQSLDIPMQTVSREKLDQLSEHANHQGIVATCEAHALLKENDLPTLLAHLTEPPFLLILDGVQDPHNLGACLRTADAAGVHAVIAPKDRSVGVTPTVRKVASGAAERVPFIAVTNLVRTMEWLKEQGVWLYGATEEAEESLHRAKLIGPIAIVMGAEGAGLRHLTKTHCDVLVHIPMLGSVASLNVSVATGVVLFETVRQRSTR